MILDEDADLLVVNQPVDSNSHVPDCIAAHVQRGLFSLFSLSRRGSRGRI